MSVAKIHSINEPREYHISDNLFAQPSSYEEKMAFEKYIYDHKISAIINVSTHVITPSLLKYYKDCGIKDVFFMPFYDSILNHNEYQPLKEKLYSLFQKTKNVGNVLVHCHAGINRSALVICTMIYVSTKMDIDYIIQKVVESNQVQRNTHALSNFTFRNLLRSIEK